MSVNLDDLAKLVSVYKKGGTRDEIAEEMGWGVPKTAYWLKRLREDGIDLPVRKGPKPLDIKQLK